jgi:hypothetical protein
MKVLHLSHRCSNINVVNLLQRRFSPVMLSKGNIVINLTSKDKSIEAHIEIYLPLMLTTYFNEKMKIYDFINHLIIIPNHYNNEHIKTDIPISSKLIYEHNKFLSTNRFSYELTCSKFNENSNIQHKYIVDCIEEYLSFSIVIEFNKKTWKVIEII